MTFQHPEFESVLDKIIRTRRSFREPGALLVGISGIDGSGKSAWNRSLTEQLSVRGWNVASFNVDAWHHPPAVRFSATDPGRHFYDHAFRWDEMFDRLILPLRKNRSVTLTTHLNRQPGDVVVEHTYDYKDIDIILFEGIFILRKEYSRIYDLTFWIECSFETALERAMARNQEGLSEAEIIHDYQNIYFAAQKIHFAEDDPKSFADVIVFNDDRIPKELSHVS